MCKRKRDIQSPHDIQCRLDEDKKDIHRRYLAEDLAPVFLCDSNTRPLAQTCRDAPKLLGMLPRAAFRLSKYAPVGMFSEILLRVHTDPAQEAAQVYNKNKARTGTPPDNMLAFQCLSQWVYMCVAECQHLKC